MFPDHYVASKITVPLIIINQFLLEARPEPRHNGIGDGPDTATQSPPLCVPFGNPWVRRPRNKEAAASAKKHRSFPQLAGGPPVLSPHHIYSSHSLVSIRP